MCLTDAEEMYEFHLTNFKVKKEFQITSENLLHFHEIKYLSKYLSKYLCNNDIRNM